MRDTDAGLLRLYQSCVDAGPAICPIHEENANLIDERVKRLIDKLSIVPLPYYNATSGLYDVLDGSDVKVALFGGLYSPQIDGKNFLTAFAELKEGNTALMMEMYPRAGLQSKLACKCPVPPYDHGSYSSPERRYSIVCGDGDELFDGIEELRKHYARMAEDSPFFSGVWDMKSSCM